MRRPGAQKYGLKLAAGTTSSSFDSLDTVVTQCKFLFSVHFVHLLPHRRELLSKGPSRYRVVGLDVLPFAVRVLAPRLVLPVLRQLFLFAFLHNAINAHVVMTSFTHASYLTERCPRDAGAFCTSSQIHGSRAVVRSSITHFCSKLITIPQAILSVVYRLGTMPT